MSTESEVQRLRGEVERHRSVTSMIAGVTHDLATPLGIINQAASIIADNVKHKTLDALAKDADARETLADVAEAARLILSSAARARALVQTFKDLAVRELTDRREVVDLEALLRETVGLFRYQAEHSELEVALEVTDGDKRWDGYPGHLSRVVLNLLSNIDRYAYPDGGGGVEIFLDASGDRFVIGVADQGRGMTEEQKSRLFEPFFTTGQAQGGTGLGMAIVQQLVVDELGGSISVQSELGEGTRIDVTLPRAVGKDDKT